MTLIALDAGHGLHTAGKRTPDGIREWVLNSAVCGYITAYLEPYSCAVLRTDDITGAVDVPLKARRSKAIDAGAAVLVSIHHNAGGGTGTEIYAARTTQTESLHLAELLAPKVADRTSMRNRGVKRAAFTVINTTKLPAVLCEGGFMDHAQDTAYIRTPQGQQAYAKAVVEALAEFLGLTKEEDAMRYQYYKDMPVWAQPTVSKLVRSGILKGEGDGVLNLSEDMLRLLVIHDRAGMYQ